MLCEQVLSPFARALVALTCLVCWIEAERSQEERELNKEPDDHELPPVGSRKSEADKNKLATSGGGKKDTESFEHDQLPPVGKKKKENVHDDELPPVGVRKKDTQSSEHDELPPVGKTKIDELPPVGVLRETPNDFDDGLPPVGSKKQVNQSHENELPPVGNNKQTKQESENLESLVGGKENVQKTHSAVVAHRAQDDQSAIVSEEEFLKIVEASDNAIQTSQQQLKEVFMSSFADAMRTLRVEMRESFDILKEIQKDGLARVEALALQERRLEVAMLHGSAGKCCCQRNSQSATNRVCHWTKQQRLVGEESKQCELDLQEYSIDLNSRSSQVGQTEQLLLDQCAESPYWLEHATDPLINDVKHCSPKLDQDMATLEAFLQS